MMAPYLLRLVCLSLAVFFAIHLAAGLLVTLAARVLVGAGRRMNPRRAAGMLLAVRLLPVALGVFVVAGICIPSYLWLEPEFSREEIGMTCLAAAMMGAIQWVLSAARGVRGMTRAARHTRDCMRLGRQAAMKGSRVPVWVLDTEAPVFALVGVFRSGVVLSGAVMRRLTPSQLGAALRHEEAHLRARDNLKRLVLLLTPDLLPGVHGFQEIERGWARFIEWAADDEAVDGDNQRSLSLAAALVRMARLGGSAAVPLSAAFMSNCGEVEARVDRLLGPVPAAAAPGGRRSAMAAGGVALTIALVACLAHPSTLAYAYRIIEEVIH